MDSLSHPYALFLGGSALVSAIAAGLALLRRGSLGMKPLALTSGLLALWAACYALVWANAGREGGHLWFYAMYFAVVGVPFSFLILVLDVTHQLKRFPRGWLALLLLEPALMLAAVWTNDLHHLFIERFSTFAAGGLVHLVVQRGPLYWVNVVYSYLLLLACMGLLVNSLVRTAPLFRRQVFAFILGASLPWLGNIATLLGLVPLNGLDVTPAAFGLTALIFFDALSSPSRFNLLPMARGLLLQVISDGLLVLDAKFRLLDANPAAERLLGMGARDLIGRDGLEVFSQWNDLPARLQEHPGELSAQIQGRHNPSQYFDLKITPINNNDVVTGYLILFRDITDRWQVEQELRQANLELQARLTEIESLHQELRAQATRDPLTNLYNRRYLEETLENELARAERDSSPISVIMLDADKFKRINDLHGHKAGDLALQALSRIILDRIRKSDIACRYGGEEFVIVMPNTELEVAHERAEMIREDFRRGDFIGPGTQAETSLSIGIATYPLSGTRGEDVLDAADQAMYAAKIEGGNRIKLQISPVNKTGLVSNPAAEPVRKPRRKKKAE